MTKLAMRGSMGEVVRDAEGRSLAQSRRADPERRDPKRAPGNDLRAIAAALEARADAEDNGWKVAAE